MQRRLSLLLLALLLAGCASPTAGPVPQPEPQQPAAVTAPNPGTAPAGAPAPGPTTDSANGGASNAATAPAPLSAGSTADLQAKLSEADHLLVAGQNREAAALLLQTVGIFPDSPGAWDLLTLALIRLNEPQAASVTGRRAVKLQPESATIRFNAGLAEYKAGFPLQAAVHLREAARLNQVRPEPLIYLALTAEWEEAQSALQELQVRFPTDPAVQLLRTNLALAADDLDGDGKPEMITKNDSQISVASGATGVLYLQEAMKASSIWTYFGLIGTAGDRFLVLNDPVGSYTLYHLVGSQFVRLDHSAGMAYFDRATQELKVSIYDRSNGNAIGITYDWQNGALVELHRKVTPNEKSPAATTDPVTDQVDLFLATLFQQGRAYTSATLLTEVQSKDKEKLGPSHLLLPTKDGYRLELWHSQGILAKATAVVNKDLRIEKLTWE